MNVPPLDVLGAERALARAGDDVLAAGGDLAEPEPVGAVDDGHDEPVLDGDRDPDVHLVVQADAAVVPGGVRLGVPCEGSRGRAHEQIGDADVATEPLAGDRRQLQSRPASTSRRR